MDLLPRHRQSMLGTSVAATILSRFAATWTSWPVCCMKSSLLSLIFFFLPSTQVCGLFNLQGPSFVCIHKCSTNLVVIGKILKLMVTEHAAFEHTIIKMLVCYDATVKYFVKLKLSISCCIVYTCGAGDSHRCAVA